MHYRIMICDEIAPAGLEILKTEAELVNSRDFSSLGDVDALIVRGMTHVTEEWISAGRPRLRVIGRAGVGVDNIDLRAARAHDIKVVNAPDAATVAVAELTMGLLLGLVRQIPLADASMRSGTWRKGAFIGQELHGKTLGILGLGRIGAAVAQRAAAFGMKVFAHDRSPLPKRVVQAKVRLVSLDELLSRSDFLSIHLPLDETTTGMIGKEELTRLKRGAFLIHTARGGIVDEQALLHALQSEHLAGAALDVFSREPPELESLLKNPHVVLTPHIGAQTREAQRRTSIDIATEVLAALNEEPLRWQIH